MYSTLSIFSNLWRVKKCWGGADKAGCGYTRLTCLSISKDAGIVAHEGIVQQTPAKALENHILTWERGQRAEDTTKPAAVSRHTNTPWPEVCVKLVSHLTPIIFGVSSAILQQTGP